MALPDPIDPQVTYDVVLSRVIKLGSLTLRPRDQHHMLGELIVSLVAEHGEDVIVSASPVA